MRARRAGAHDAELRALELVPIALGQLQERQLAIGELEVPYDGSALSRLMHSIREDVLARGTLGAGGPFTVELGLVPARCLAFVRAETGIPLRELLQIFNMGHRLEVVCEDRVAPQIIGIAAEFGLEAQVVGRVEAAPGRSLFIELCGEVNEFRSF